MGELKCQINMTSIVPQKLLGLQNGKWKNLSNYALSEKGERSLVHGCGTSEASALYILQSQC